LTSIPTKFPSKKDKVMLVYELDCTLNEWILVSETTASFYDHVEVTYF